MLLTRSYARACRRDIGKILLSSRVGGSSLFSHSFDRRFFACPKPSTCLLHTTTVTAIYTSSSDNSEEKGKKIRQRKSKLKSANGDDDPVPTSENSKEQVKTETKKNANGPASLDSSASEETGKKRRIKSKLKKSVNGDDDPVPIATSNDKKTRTRKSRKSTDESTADLSKQKKKKEKKSPDISDQELKDLLLGPFIPFEGTVKHINTADTKSLHDGSFSIDRQDSLEGRCYHIKSSAGHDMSTYSFPSVTTILQNTVEKGSYYRLLNWRRKLTAEHGMGGFDAIVKSTLKSGSNFHKVCA